MLELLIVLVILAGFMGIVALGLIQVMANEQLQTTVDQLAADIRVCQSDAVLQQKPCSILLTGTDSYVIQLATGKQKTVRFPSGIRLAEKKLGISEHEIRFNEQGHPFGSGSLVLENRAGKRIRLTLYLHSGQIHITEGD